MVTQIYTHERTMSCPRCCVTSGVTYTIWCNTCLGYTMMMVLRSHGLCTTPGVLCIELYVLYTHALLLLSFIVNDNTLQLWVVIDNLYIKYKTLKPFSDI